MFDPARVRAIDLTYGKGAWWQRVRPPDLTAVDIERHPEAPPEPKVLLMDATMLPDTVPGWRKAFTLVAVDPPYKLNGTDQGEGRRYGVHGYGSVAYRHELAYRLLAAGAWLLAPGGILLYKCMAQVNGGRLRWQNYDAYGWATSDLGLSLIEELGVIGGRAQPDRFRWRCLACQRENTGPSHTCVLAKARPDYGPDWKSNGQPLPWLVKYPSRQEHAYGRPSQLMVFQRPPRA